MKHRRRFSRDVGPAARVPPPAPAAPNAGAARSRRRGCRRRGEIAACRRYRQRRSGRPRTPTRRRQVVSGGAARRDRLIDRVDRLLHQQRGQLVRVLHPDAAMADAAVVAAEQVFRRGVVQVDVEPVRHLELDLSERCAGSGQLLQCRHGQHHHVMPAQIIRVVPQLRQDLLRGDRVRDVPWRVEQNSVDCGAELRALILPTSWPTMTRVVNTGRSARYSTSRASARLTQTRSAGSRRGSQRWRSRLTSISRRRFAAALSPAGGAGAIVLQSLAQRPVGRRRRRQRLDRRRRIGAADRVVERSSDIDRLRRQFLVVHPALNRHGAAGQRVGIGEKGVRQQQFAVERRQCRGVPQQVA